MSLPSVASTGSTRVLVLEAGSNSLKMYAVDPAHGEEDIEVHKYTWSVAHEFFSTGELSPAIVDELCGCIESAAKDAGDVHIASAIAIATGVFRETRDLDQLFAAIVARTGVRLRLISGTDEARLMAKGMRELPIELPTLLCDLGGASLEWALLREGHRPVCGSVRLGAIRNEYLLDSMRDAHEAYVRGSDIICDAQLDKIPVEGRVNVVVTGGTCKALAKLVGSDEVSAEQIDEWIGRVQRDGPPEQLKRARQKVLLPGLCILRRLVGRFGRGGLRYGTAAVRYGMVRRLLALLDEVPRADLHASMLLRTRDGRALLDDHWTIELSPGATLGRYEVIGKIGRGAMGVVYRATDPQLGREVALKVMRAGGAAGQRLLEEAQALARVSHPNVVTVHDVGRLEDDVFVAMELIEGQTLSAWVEAEPRTHEEILQMFLAAGRGLAATHEKKLIQRDFKPDNVLVGHDGRVCLVDFGLARLSEEEPSSPPGEAEQGALVERLQTGLAGTPAYMAPEQFTRGTVDARTDQFSYCVALWEALYGQPPFAGETVEQLGQSVTAGRLEPAPSNVAIPQYLHDAMRRGLAALPGERFASMSELLAALEPPRRRRPSKAMLVGGTITAAAIALGLYAWVERGPAVDPCTHTEQRLAGVWDDALEQSVREAFMRTELPYAETAYQRVAKVLDGYAAEWVVLATESCQATVDERGPSPHYAAQQLCLNARLEQLRELSTKLSTELDGESVDDAVSWAFELAPVADCLDPSEERDSSEAEPPPPRPSAEACGLPLEGLHYNPIEVGRTWLYDVIDPSTRLPLNEDPKVVEVEALEQIGGCKGPVEAYRMRRSTELGYALRWIEVREEPGSEGQPPGQLVLRHRDQWVANDDVVRKEEYYEPARAELYETCARTALHASYVDAYEEFELELGPGSESEDPSAPAPTETAPEPSGDACEVPERSQKTFDWHIVAHEEPVTLTLDYSRRECCAGRPRSACRPPDDGPGHRCRRSEDGKRSQWICEFNTIQVVRSEVGGGRKSIFWFAPGVGKVKEDSKGDELETLVCFGIPQG